MGEAAALVSAFTWSGTSVALASIAARTSPVVLSAIRLVAGSIILFLALILAGQAGELADAPTSSVVAMVGSGIVGYALGDTLYIRALNLVGIQRTFTVTMALFIFLTVLGGIVVLDEPFAWIQAVGTVFIVAGIFLIVRSPGRATAGSATAVPVAGARAWSRIRGRRRPGEVEGYVIVGVVGVLWAVATLWLASGRDELGSLAAASLRIPAGAIGLVIFALVTTPNALAAPFTNRRQLLAIIAVGVFGTAFGSLAYVYAVGEAGAARSTILSSVSPLMVLPLSVIFLGERLSPRVLVGTALSVIGIVLVVV